MKNQRAEIEELCQAFLTGVKDTLGDNLHGLYLYGAVAFPDGAPTGDIDFHAILNEPLDEATRAELIALHDRLAQDYPPLGAELDGYYILLEDARQTALPRHQIWPEIRDDSWALHRAHIRAGRNIVLHGPDPLEIFSPASWPELEIALQWELDYVERHLEVYAAYCVLNLCRLMYSYQNRDVVVSKFASAEWAEEAYPQWRALIDAARRSYHRQDTAADRELLRRQVGSFFEFASERIRASRTAP